MREYLDDLLTSEVAAIAGVNHDAVKNWIKLGHLPPPPKHGKHRCYGAENTVQAILMTALNGHGLRPSVAGPMAVRAAPHIVAHYTDDFAEQRGDEIVMTAPWVVIIDLANKFSTCGHAEALKYAPGDWLKIDLAPIMGAALTRALAIKKAKDAI